MEALYPITRATLDIVARNGPVASVTGPVVRGDLLTLRTHLEALFQRLPEAVPLYGSLTSASLVLAARRGVGPEQITAIQELVDHYAGAE